MSVYCILFCFVFSLYSGGVGYWSTAGTTVYVFFVYSELCWENQKKVENTSENRFGWDGRGTGGSWGRGSCEHQMPATFEGRAPVIKMMPPTFCLVANTRQAVWKDGFGCGFHARDQGKCLRLRSSSQGTVGSRGERRSLLIGTRLEQRS